MGADRYATSALVAGHFFPGRTLVGVATGLAFPDALAASPYLGSRQAPVLLVPPTGTLPAADASYLTGAPTIGSAVVFGGLAAVSDQVASEVQAALGA